MPATTYMANLSLGNEFGTSGSYAPPASYWLGLSTSVIESDGVAVEPASGAYARVEIPNNDAYWSTPASGSVTTSASVAFAQSSDSWGTIYSIFLADAITSGSILYYYNSYPTFPVVENTVVTFAEGSIMITRT